MPIGIGLRIKNSAEAVKTYIEAFGLELGYHVLNDDGSFFHSELVKNGEELLSVVEWKSAGGENPVQLGFTFETRRELEHAFSVLRQGGEVTLDICELPWSPCAAEVTDRFGVNWYLTLQQHRPPEDFVPGQEKL